MTFTHSLRATADKTLQNPNTGSESEPQIIFSTHSNLETFGKATSVTQVNVITARGKSLHDARAIRTRVHDPVASNPARAHKKPGSKPPSTLAGNDPRKRPFGAAHPGVCDAQGPPGVGDGRANAAAHGEQQVRAHDPRT